MINIALFCGGDLDYFTDDFDYFVGVDRGSLVLIENHLPLDLAIGDFDSVSADERNLIGSKAKEFITAPAEKNDTDTEFALKTIFNRFSDTAQVTLFGAFGGRVDHTLANIFLPSDPELYPYMQNIKIQDCQNELHFFPAGRHQVEQKSGMSYISFMTADASRIEIMDAKYELSEKNYFLKKIYSSNEFVGKPIHFKVYSGYAIVIQTKDRI
ncbi:thiamine diphosphokinase [Streptococcus macacae]|uniref:Thiamine diphosphokinase n=1 Tax=Streptococcus macacae NCTC 11558 TaxID=764298 RepID=G5JX43_9STRE|nr:thiamine diphosphokinase [Streptococcus macacae]EHJ51978.1 thiamine diphosphokinase [Streptococcus macacae NCTC 11558]SUN77817.1 thiamine pyrophosphokinase [Streptococcus macacae NCTC 11558]